MDWTSNVNCVILLPREAAMLAWSWGS